MAPLWVSQNFLTSSSVVNRIIQLSSISKSDHVVEIGPGKGHITRRLIEKSGQVTAVEYDPSLYGQLLRRFQDSGNLQCIHADFLRWPLPKTPYKIFANIPFHRTTEIIKRITQSANPPDDAWLIVEKGASKRITGRQAESTLSLLIKPQFDAEICYHFRREDFHPSPSVEVVLLHLHKKAGSDIETSLLPAYRKFITDCRAAPNGIRNYLTKKQVSTALRLAKLSSDTVSGEMLYVQWLCLFRCCLQFKRV